MAKFLDFNGWPWASDTMSVCNVGSDGSQLFSPKCQWVFWRNLPQWGKVKMPWNGGVLRWNNWFVVLKQAEVGTSLADLICKVGIKEQIFNPWRKHYIGLESEQLCRCKPLRKVTAWLKRASPIQCWYGEVLKEIRRIRFTPRKR